MYTATEILRSGLQPASQFGQPGADGAGGGAERAPVESAAEGSGVGGRRAQATEPLARLFGEDRPAISVAGRADGQCVSLGILDQ